MCMGDVGLLITNSFICIHFIDSSTVQSVKRYAAKNLPDVDAEPNTIHRLVYTS